MKITDEKTMFTLYNTHKKPHIRINEEICSNVCKTRFCTFICPAGCFEYDEEQGRVIFSFEGCLECGTCLLSCEEKAIDWNYPEGGFGVIFRLS